MEDQKELNPPNVDLGRPLAFTDVFPACLLTAANTATSTAENQPASAILLLISCIIELLHIACKRSSEV